MNTNELFIVATREKYRFPYKGQISVEDLWDLSENNLDSIFKNLNAMKKQNNEESLLSTKSKVSELIDNKIEIIKYIVSVKLTEKAERENAVAKKEYNQKILSIIAEKKDAALHNMSVEELEKLLND